MNTQYTVFVVEPEHIVRDALSMLINSIEGFTVVGGTSSTEEAIKILNDNPVDIVVTELAFPMQSGLELMQALRGTNSKCRFVVLAHFISESSARNALSLGATSVISKSAATEEFATALHNAGANIQTEDSSLGSRIERENGRAGLPKLKGIDPLGLLSNREKEIFHHLANGLPNAAIAKRLFISPRTVETHRARIVRKLGIKTNAELIRYAIREGVAGV